MSIVNDDRDLETLCVDIRTGDLSDKDLHQIADALPAELLAETFLRRFTQIFPRGRAELRSQKLAVIARLMLAWEKHPGERLGQFIVNAHRSFSSRRAMNKMLFYIEDDSLLHAFESYTPGE